MKHLGDITQINGSMAEPVNVIIGGSPCQDLSVAGRRAGLAGDLSLCVGCGHPTMASLFDGIGGFPLIWEWLNGKGSCLWASEIEDFPIAVTKYHFPEEGENNEH